MAEQNRKPPLRRSRQLRPGHDRCGRCLLHGAPSPNGPNRATLPGQVWVALSPKVAVQTFLREWMENHIKSWKRHLAADRTSCTKATANQVRLFLHAGAYWLMWSLRTLMPRRSSWRTLQFDTLRLRLVKLAVRVVELKDPGQAAPAQQCILPVHPGPRPRSHAAPDQLNRGPVCPTVTRLRQPPAPPHRAVIMPPPTWQRSRTPAQPSREKRLSLPGVAPA